MLVLGDLGVYLPERFLASSQTLCAIGQLNIAFSGPSRCLSILCGERQDMSDSGENTKRFAIHLEIFILFLRFS